MRNYVGKEHSFLSHVHSLLPHFFVLLAETSYAMTSSGPDSKICYPLNPKSVTHRTPVMDFLTGILVLTLSSFVSIININIIPLSVTMMCALYVHCLVLDGWRV